MLLRLFSIGIGVLLLSNLGHAQDDPVPGFLEAKHIVKTNLVSYAVLAVNANYEYKAGANTSVGLLAGYKLPQTIAVEANGELDGETMTYEGEVEPSGLYFNPYFRLYPSGAMSGFYIEAFTRYTNYDFEVPYTYTREDNGNTVSTALDGDFEAFGGGIGFGGQLSLAERWFLDLNLGFGLASGNVYMVTDDPSLTPEDYMDIAQSIEENRDDADVEIFLLGDVITDIEAKGEEDRAWARIDNQIFPIIRGGISIGYAF